MAVEVCGGTMTKKRGPGLLGKGWINRLLLMFDLVRQTLQCMNVLAFEAWSPQKLKANSNLKRHGGLAVT
eukprot:360354-Chlamydomonas_euryale.AAC.3